MGIHRGAKRLRSEVVSQPSHEGSAVGLGAAAEALGVVGPAPLLLGLSRHRHVHCLVEGERGGRLSQSSSAVACFELAGRRSQWSSAQAARFGGEAHLLARTHSASPPACSRPCRGCWWRERESVCVCVCVYVWLCVYVCVEHDVLFSKLRLLGGRHLPHIVKVLTQVQGGLLD